MRQPQLWDEDDLLGLIEHKYEENIQLEYKRSAALQPRERERNEISKDVSAFANSIGGTVVYGMDESHDAPHYALRLSPIDPQQISKEWLEQVINSRIQPRIPGLVINPVEIKRSTPAGLVYVVVIPESTTAHQASDKRYYKRFNFQSVPMEDYEIRQTMNRASRPAYRTELLRRWIRTGAGDSAVFRFDLVVENRSDLVGHDVSAVLFTPRGHLIPPDDDFTRLQGVPYTRIAGVFAPGYGTLVSAIPSAHPLARYQIGFPKEIQLATGSPPTSFVVKVFDQFGVALTAHYKVDISKSTLENEVHAARRSPSMFALDSLE